MILSHGVNALLPFSDFPAWGQVPVHALTKFSSSLFVIVFGVALAVAFVPKALDADWPRRRNRLLRRGLWEIGRASCREGGASGEGAVTWKERSRGARG